MRKLNLLLIGAQKSGSTSLHRCLEARSDIHMSSPQKEPRFFMPFGVSQKYFSRHGIEIESKQHLMRRLMMRGLSEQKYFGESSTAYTIGHNSRSFDLPRKIYEYNPDTKIIYLLRNPFSRIVSQYKHLLRTKATNHSFETYLSSEQFKDRDLYTSLYYFQLKPWLQHFATKSIHVAIFEHFIQQSENSFSKLWNFLELEDNNSSFSVHNASSNSSDVQFSPSCRNQIYSVVKSDICNLSEFLNIDLFETWDI